MDNNRINLSYKNSALCFEGIYGLIIFSCMADYRHAISDNEKEQIFNSNFVPNLLYNLDIFSDGKNDMDLDENFFKEYKKINKFNKETENTYKFIDEGIFYQLEKEYCIERHIVWCFRDCATFLAETYALHRNSYDVSCEDIVNGWLLTLKLFTMDLRPLIFDK